MVLYFFPILDQHFKIKIKRVASMENTKSLYDKDGKEQSGLTLRLDYMVDDFTELVQKEESKNLAVEES